MQSKRDGSQSWRGKYADTLVVLQDMIYTSPRRTIGLGKYLQASSSPSLPDNNFRFSVIKNLNDNKAYQCMHDHFVFTFCLVIFLRAVPVYLMFSRSLP